MARTSGTGSAVILASFAGENALVLAVAVQMQLFISAMTVILCVVRDARTLDL